ncbi:MAG: hypothetical protein QM778_26075 [Myxococcales bacterium]
MRRYFARAPNHPLRRLGLGLGMMLAAGCTDPCGERSIADCNDGCSVVHGKPADEALMCLGETQAAGCMESGHTCQQQIGLARDTKGNLWWFPNICIPENWTLVNDESGAEDWSACMSSP